MERLERFRKDIWPLFLFLIFVAAGIFLLWLALKTNRKLNGQDKQASRIEKKTENASSSAAVYGGVFLLNHGRGISYFKAQFLGKARVNF